MMQVGIVNDLRVVAEALRRIIAETPGFSVGWVAHDGASAIDRYRTQPVDIVLMDLVMPGMDGAQTTEAMMKVRPCAILVVTATVIGNRELVYAAMGKGALDAVNTPDASSPESVAHLRKKLTTVSPLVASAHRHPAAQPTGPFARQSPNMAQRSTGEEHGTALIGIGASTGGPQAIATILRGLPQNLNAAIVIVQHLDRQFVPGLERWLQRETKLPIRLAMDDQPIHRGGVWLADSENHLTVRGSTTGALRIHYTDQPVDCPNRPSVDVFFESLTQLRGIHRCGVLLTGMGSDGAEGLFALRQVGAPTFAQDADSCVVYGMPSIALKLGAVAHSTKLSDMSLRLLEFAGQQPPSNPINPEK